MGKAENHRVRDPANTRGPGRRFTFVLFLKLICAVDRMRTRAQYSFARMSLCPFRQQNPRLSSSRITVGTVLTLTWSDAVDGQPEKGKVSVVVFICPS